MGQNEKERSAGRVAANDNRLNRARRASGAVDRTELAGVEKKMAAMISAIEDGGYVKGMADRLRELEARQEELKERLAAVCPKIPDIHPNIADVYRRKVARLAEALVKPEERDAAASAIRGLIERIVLISGEKWGEMHAARRPRRHPRIGGKRDRKGKDRHTRPGTVGLSGCGARNLRDRHLIEVPV